MKHLYSGWAYEDVSKLDVGAPPQLLNCVSVHAAYAPTESGGEQRREEDHIYRMTIINTTIPFVLLDCLCALGLLISIYGLLKQWTQLLSRRSSSARVWGRVFCFSRATALTLHPPENFNLAFLIRSNLPNRQIETTAKFSCYTVFAFQWQETTPTTSSACETLVRGSFSQFNFCIDCCPRNLHHAKISRYILYTGPNQGVGGVWNEAISLWLNCNDVGCGADNNLISAHAQRYIAPCLSYLSSARVQWSSLKSMIVNDSTLS